MKLSPQGKKLRAKTGLRTSGRKRQRRDRAGGGSSSSERGSNLLHRRSLAGDRKRPQEEPCRPQPAERWAAALRAAPRSLAAPAPRRPPLPVHHPQAAPGLRSRPAPLPPPARSLAHHLRRRVPPRPSGACALRRSPPSGSAAGRRDGSHGETESRGLDPGGGERPAAHPAPVRAAGPCSAPLYAAGGTGPGGGGPAGRSERSVAVGERRSGSGGPQERLGRNLATPARLVLRESGVRARIATDGTAAVFQNPGSFILAALIASRFRCDRRSRSVTLSIWA